MLSDAVLVLHLTILTVDAIWSAFPLVCCLPSTPFFLSNEKAQKLQSINMNGKLPAW